jgi:hypothetical protein
MRRHWLFFPWQYMFAGFILLKCELFGAVAAYRFSIVFADFLAMI